MNWSKIRVAFPAVGVLLLVAACGPGNGQAPDSDSASGGGPVSLEELVAAAEEEGELTVYSSMGEEVLTAALEQFESQYDVETSMVRKTSSELIQQFENERQGGVYEADVLTHSTFDHLVDLAEQDELLALEGLPETDGWPEEFRPEGDIVNFSISPWSIAWNTDVVSSADAPQTWEDIPGLEDEIPVTLQDPTVADSYMAFFDAMYDEYGEEFLAGLGERKDAVHTSGTPAMQSLAAGEFGVAVAVPWDAMLAVKGQGAPVDGVVPDFTGGSERMGAVPANAPHPNAARLFMNFLMSAEGQQAVNGEPFNTISPLPEIPGARDLPPRYEAPDIESARENADMISEFLGL